MSSSMMQTADQLDYQRGVQNEPLTERDIKLVARLLADPSIFPREFKRWVTDHASDTVDIAKSQVHGLINSAGSIIFSNASWEQLSIALVGLILPYPSTTPPKGWLRCDGSMVSETEWEPLFKLIGHSFDVSSQSGKFALPDLRGRTIFGWDDVPGTSACAYGQHEGSQAGGRGPRHSHDVAAHSHGFSHTHTAGNYSAVAVGDHSHWIGVTLQLAINAADQQASFPSVAIGNGFQSTNAGAHGHSIGGTSGGASPAATSDASPGTSGGPRKDVGSYLALNYIIAGGNVPD